MRSIVTGVAVLLALSGIAEADQKVTMRRKPGLWEVSATTDGHPMPTGMKQCADEATDAKMMQLSQQEAAQCKVSDFIKTAEGYEFSSECQLGATKVVSKGTFSGDFDAEYRGEILTTMTPPLFGRGESKSTITAKWVGPCPAGMKPGQMKTDNGETIDLEQARQGAKMAAEMMKNPEMQKMLKNAIAGASGMEQAVGKVPAGGAGH